MKIEHKDQAEIRGSKNTHGSSLSLGACLCVLNHIFFLCIFHSDTSVTSIEHTTTIYTSILNEIRIIFSRIHACSSQLCGQQNKLRPIYLDIVSWMKLFFFHSICRYIGRCSTKFLNKMRPLGRYCRRIYSFHGIQTFKSLFPCLRIFSSGCLHVGQTFITFE